MDSLVANADIISFYLLVEDMCICVYYCKHYKVGFINLHKQYGYLLVEADVHEYMWLLL